MVIAVAGVGFAGVRYAGLDRLVGSRGYVVTVQLAESGGIFSNAEVAYRGVTIGRVAELHLSESGIDVDLDIDPSAPAIPADTRAVVANRSAVGEQYVDLRPEDEDGPYLAQGSVIPVERTEIPPAPESVLGNVDRLVTSVPIEDLRTVVDELGQAFTDAGPHLRTLLDNADSFTTTAAEHLPQTKALLADSRTVLATQERDARQIVSMAEDLNTIAKQLRTSDPALRDLVRIAPQVSVQATEILRDSGSALSVLLANLLTTAQLTTSRKAGIEQVLVAYPMMANLLTTVFPGDGTAHMGLVLNFNDPFICTRGYEGTVQRSGTDATPIPANTNAYCAEPAGSPINVRGSNNAPFPGSPPQQPATPAPLPPPATSPAPHSSLPGMSVLGPDQGRATSLAQLLGLPG